MSLIRPHSTISIADGKAALCNNAQPDLCVPKTLNPTIAVMKSAQDGAN
jgi:hypothetical protein